MSTAPPPRSPLQEKIGQDTVSATELRLRLYELPVQLGAMIETAADRIRGESSDPAVRRRALLWKADGIPALLGAALRPDPFAGGYDLWVYIVQMDLYFREGIGKDAFGLQQPIATAAVAKMLAVVEETAASLAPDRETQESRKLGIERFARQHPIEGAFSSRDTTIIELARLSHRDVGGGLAGVGLATETLSDITLRLNAYVTLLPKVARWQTELAAEDMGLDTLRGALGDIQAVGGAARRADSLLSNIPGAVREANAPFQELLDRQRDAFVAEMGRARLAVTALITEERTAALAGLTEERKAALASISEERAAMQVGFDALARRSIDDVSGRMRGTADYIFVRALILVVAAALLFGVAYRLAGGRRRLGERE